MESSCEKRARNERSNCKPPGIHLLEYKRQTTVRFRTYQVIVLILTFFAYCGYHATRKATSIVKSTLDPKAPGIGCPKSPVFLKPTYWSQERTSVKSGWAPFDGSDGTAMLGEIDVAFLSIYSIAMYFAGHLGDRINLRIFLTIGMIGTGIFTALFGAGYWLNIHNFFYYLGIQMLAGVFQSTGWPMVVAIIGNWFGKNRRGLIMGIWNAHTSVGSITGSLVASALLVYGWGWSFAVPGLIIAVFGVVVFLFLPVSPKDIDIEEEQDESLMFPGNTEVTKPLLVGRTESREKAVGFIKAWKIPGVAPFALCLFFSKLVAYTFLYWLPFYISHTAIDGEYLSDSSAGTLSTLFDVGGVLGGILAGHISDCLDARAITAASFMYCAIPALFLYRTYSNISIYWNATLMFITGMFVNGPYALITTAVSADLGTHSSLNGNSRALATVSAIINGTGSVGAAIGPLLTGYISASSWGNVFAMLMVAALIAGMLLTKLVIAEVAKKIEASKSHANETITTTSLMGVEV